MSEPFIERGIDERQRPGVGASQIRVFQVNPSCRDMFRKNVLELLWDLGSAADAQYLKRFFHFAGGFEYVRAVLVAAGLGPRTKSQKIRLFDLEPLLEVGQRRLIGAIEDLPIDPTVRDDGSFGSYVRIKAQKITSSII